MNTFSVVFLLMLMLVTATRLWLAQRQHRHVLDHRHRVPETFAGHISLDNHLKSADYTCATMRLEQISTVYSALLLLFWTLGGGLELLDKLWLDSTWPVLLAGTAIVLIFIFLNQFLELPLNLYRTFVIEQRFGFNHTRPGLYIADLGREALLTLLIGTPVIAAALWLMQSGGNLWWVFVWLLWMALSLLMLWSYPVLIAPLFNTFSTLSDAGLKNRIETLLEKTGFRSNGIFVMDSSRRTGHGNAYFTGLGRQKRIVFYDTLLDSLNADETEAVLAHELGHYRRHHVHQRLLWTACLSLTGCALLAWLAGQEWFYHGLGMQRPSAHAAILLFLLAVPVFSFFLHPLLLLQTRRHEFEADEFATRYTAAGALTNALLKLYEDNATTLTPDPLYSVFHDTHPPAPVRIAHLETK